MVSNKVHLFIFLRVLGYLELVNMANLYGPLETENLIYEPVHQPTEKSWTRQVKSGNQYARMILALERCFVLVYVEFIYIPVMNQDSFRGFYFPAHAFLLAFSSLFSFQMGRPLKLAWNKVEKGWKKVEFYPRAYVKERARNISGELEPNPKMIIS